MMKKLKNVLIILVVFILGVAAAKSESLFNYRVSNKFEILSQIMEQQYYFKHQINMSYQVEKALAALVSNDRDPYTVYMEPNTSALFLSQLNNSQQAIGIHLEKVDGVGILISAVIDDSPAQKAGIEVGDIITKVNNRVIADLDTEEIRQLILEGNTAAELTIERENNVLNLLVEKNEILTATKLMELNNTSYLQYTGFQDDTVEIFKEKLIQAKKYSDNLILDLRNNPGGSLNVLIALASLFIDNNQIIINERFADGSILSTRVTDSQQDQFNFKKIVILINENTASAAEVMAISLKENLDNVSLVGTKSYGKGTVQNISQIFDDGSILKYTIAQWLSPKMQEIDRIGISPDIQVENHKFNYIYSGKETSAKLDTVSELTLKLQELMNDIDNYNGRIDGYFDQSFDQYLTDFTTKHQIFYQHEIDNYLFAKIKAYFLKLTNTDPSQYDLQLQQALTVING